MIVKTKYLYYKETGNRYEVLAEYEDRVWAIPRGATAPLTYKRSLFTDRPEIKEGSRWQWRATNGKGPLFVIHEATDRHVVYQNAGGDITYPKAVRDVDDFLDHFTPAED